MEPKSDKTSPVLVMELGSVIAAARTRRRMNQTDVALLTGIPISTYRRYEKKGPAKVGEAFAIAQAIGVPLSELVREAEEGPPVSAPQGRRSG